MKRIGTRIGLSIALTLAASSCGSPPVPPEGFTVQVRFVSIDVEILERLVISIRPSSDMYFEPVPDGSFEGGAITTHVEEDGTLTMSITGDHVRENAFSTDGIEQSYEVQIWSADTVSRTGAQAPQIHGFAYRSGEVIGDDSRFMPVWPPPIEESGMCTGGSSCRMQLVIDCVSVRPERCRP